MKKWLLSLRNQKGMTLIELMGVVIILGVVATVATAVVVNSSAKAKVSADNTSISVIKDAVQRYLIDTPAPVAPVPANTLVILGYLREVPKDSNNNPLDIVAYTYIPTSGLITDWKFHIDGNKRDDFAPKATNR